jgi:hypothetical protein
MKVLSSKPHSMLANIACGSARLSHERNLGKFYLNATFHTHLLLTLSITLGKNCSYVRVIKGLFITLLLCTFPLTISKAQLRSTFESTAFSGLVL